MGQIKFGTPGREPNWAKPGPETPEKEPKWPKSGPGTPKIESKGAKVGQIRLWDPRN